MGDFVGCPAEALKAAEAVCGAVELTAITDRRGCAVWKAAGPAASVAIKYGRGEGTEATVREARVLGRLPGRRVTAGRAGEGSWLVTPWLHGPSTWQLFGPVRKGIRGHDQVLAGAVELCRAVAELHAAGWAHGDLQPAHGVHTADGVRLLDFAWSWREGARPWPAFHGGITHLVAPELAERIVTDPRSATPAPAADVYALAGTLWTCTTGRWPLDYAAAGLPPQTEPAGRREAIATGRIPLDRATPWPSLQSALRPVLLDGPAARPTAAELAAVLAATVTA